MIEIPTLIFILFVHFIADFVLQSDDMAKGKSSSNKWLGLHCLVYGLCFLPLSPLYALVNASSHFCIDYVTSRINKKLWGQGRVHDFFVSIGFDQFLHVVILILTFIWLL